MEKESRRSEEDLEVCRKRVHHGVKFRGCASIEQVIHRPGTFDAIGAGGDPDLKPLCSNSSIKDSGRVRGVRTRPRVSDLRSLGVSFVAVIDHYDAYAPIIQWPYR